MGAGMMPLGVADVLVILGTALGCAVVVGALALLAIRLLRARPLFVHFLVVPCAALLATAASVLAISVEMYLSPHDLTVLVWVLGVSTVFGTGLAWALARLVRRGFSRATRSARAIGDASAGGASAVPVASGPGGDSRGGIEPGTMRAGAAEPAEFAELTRELSDVSERVREARAELERLDSARRRFFAWISHDLRTPLTALRAMSEAAASSEASADLRGFAERVGAQSVSMSRLVDDLFELSRLGAGTVRLQTEQVDLLDVVSDAVAEVRVAAARRGVRIVAREVAGQAVWADPHQLGRVVTNLLTNAVRHAPEGTAVLISVSALPGERVVLGVLDQGGGVAVSDLDRMFDVGWRASASRGGGSGDAVDSAIAPGSGLGLAIARGLARAHGGDVVAEHTDAGFRVSVELPVHAGA